MKYVLQFVERNKYWSKYDKFGCYIVNLVSLNYQNLLFYHVTHWTGSLSHILICGYRDTVCVIYSLDTSPIRNLLRFEVFVPGRYVWGPPAAGHQPPCLWLLDSCPWMISGKTPRASGGECGERNAMKEPFWQPLSQWDVPMAEWLRCLLNEQRVERA